MLAETTMAEVFGAPQVDTGPSIFPHWEAFHAEPNREQRSADLLEERARKVVYWPHYWTQIRCGTRRQREIARSVIPGVLFAPTGTPKPVMEKLTAALKQTLADPSMKELFSKLGFDVMTEPPAEVQAMIQQQYDLWGPLIKELNLKLE